MQISNDLGVFQSSNYPWLSEEEAESYQRPAGGGDPYFFGRGHRYYIRNGAEELLLDLAPRALWGIAEQLLGVGEVVWPAGIDKSGTTVGPRLVLACKKKKT